MNPISPVTPQSDYVEEISTIVGIDFNPTNVSVPFDANAGLATSSGNRIPYLLGDDLPVNSGNDKAVQYKPLEIKFTSGIYDGQILDLGSNIQEFSGDQTANWEEKRGQKQRVGLEFNSISPRQLSFTLEFYSEYDDVQPLAENLAHLMEIQGDNNEPSRVTVQVGQVLYRNAVCTKFAPKYSIPHPEAKGFRQAMVQLEFKVAGGVGSPYQSAAPFGDTELALWANSQTISSLRENAAQNRRQALISCLDDGEDETYEAMLQQLEDNPQTITSLPDNLFLQVSIGGVPENVRSDATWQNRLKQILAYQIAGVYVEEPQATNYANILINNGDTSAIPIADRELVLAFDDIFGKTVAGTAHETVALEYSSVLSRIGSCGLFLAEQGGLALGDAEREVDSAWALNNFNQLLEDNSKRRVSDADLRRILNLPNNREGDEILATLKETKVYNSKEEFVDQFRGTVLADDTSPFSPYNSWSHVLAEDSRLLDDLNNFLVNASDGDAVQEKVKPISGSAIEQAIADELVGVTFTSKEAFLQRVYELKYPDRTYNQAEALEFANKYWLGFRTQNQDSGGI